MSEKEKTAKEVGKKAKKLAGDDAGFGAERNAVGRIGEFQGDYGVDYFSGTKAQEHARDTQIKAKVLSDIRDIYAQNGQTGLVTNLAVTPEDVAAYKSFLNLEYLRDFDYFTGDKFLKDANPAQVKWIHDIYPDLFTRRVEELDKILDVQKRVAMLNIMGPRSKEDLLFMYELNRFKTKDINKFNAVVNTSVAASTGEVKYTRGALNVKEMFHTFPSNTERVNSDGIFAKFSGTTPTGGVDKTSRQGHYQY